MCNYFCSNGSCRITIIDPRSLWRCFWELEEVKDTDFIFHPIARQHTAECHSSLRHATRAGKPEKHPRNGSQTVRSHVACTMHRCTRTLGQEGIPFGIKREQRKRKKEARREGTPILDLPSPTIPSCMQHPLARALSPTSSLDFFFRISYGYRNNSRRQFLIWN